MNDNKTNINWYKPNYGKLHMKAYNKEFQFYFFLHFITEK